MKLALILVTLTFTSAALAFNCKKECKAEFGQCQILVKKSNAELESFHRSLPYDRATLKRKLREVKLKKKEELGYCKEMKSECFADCRE